MYSSWLGGITKSPGLMQVPIDDHIVHRGDGVFEAMRFSHGAVYDFNAHMARLERSAVSIEMHLPFTRSEIGEIIRDLIKVAGVAQAMIRLYASRGPGGFTTNPYESVGSQLYVVLTELKLLPESQYQSGVTAQFSKVAIKPGPWSGIKSCNYLPNVMMKKEAVDAGVFMTIALTPEGYVAEGSTENVAFVISDELCVPKFDYTLKGTTLLRVIELAESYKSHLGVKSVRQINITKEKASLAQEAFFVGTTLEVLPIATLNAKPLVRSGVGPVAQKLRELLQVDMRENSACRFEA